MHKTAIVNGQVILPEGILPRGYVEWTDDRITAVGSGDYAGEGHTIDAGGLYISPGFIDMHTHGAGGHDFMDGTVEAYLGAARMHALHGTTALAPTTLSCTDEELFNTFAVFKEARKQTGQGARLLGLHLEGPYFAFSKRGAQDPRFLRNPRPEEYETILAASDDIIRWSLAPELDGALEFGRRLCAKGILPAIAHTDALYEETVAAFEAGFTHITHLYSCMSSLTRRHGYRFAGVLEAAYLLDDMTVEIIADGIHLPKTLLQYVCKFKNHDHIALVTDSMRAAGMPEGEYILGGLTHGQRVIVEDGVAKLPDRSAFAGSVATADRLVRTMIDLAELPLHEAVRMISLNPARILKIDAQYGSLSPGKKADILLFDERIHIQQTFIDGQPLHD